MATVGNLITDNLDIWSSAVKAKSAAGRGTSKKIDLYGIKKLRELILELAVRGLLVPQDPSDEPASELLGRIAAEKARLLKERKIKRQQPLPLIEEDEKPFDLPPSWEWVRLQEISEYIQRGKGPKYSDSGKVRVVSQKCIQWSGFDLDVSRYVEDESIAKYQEERFLKNNDLLWNSTGTGTAGRINLIKDIDLKSLVADSHVTVIRTLLKYPGFICNYISSGGVQKRFEPSSENSIVSGTTNQVELNTSTVAKILIPLPSEAEQHRIVAKVDEIMALCDQLEQQQEASTSAHQTLVTTLLGALTTASEREGFTAAWARIAEHFDTLFTTEWSIDQLKQTILQLAVMGKLVSQNLFDESAAELLKKIYVEKADLMKHGRMKKQKPVTQIDEKSQQFGLPQGWGWCRLQNIVYLLGDGIHGTPEYSVNKKYYFVNGNNLKNGKVIIKHGTKTVDQEQYEKYRKDLGKNTVLVSINGTLGNVAFFNNENIVLGKSACYFNLSGRISKEYIKYVIESPAFIEYAFREATGSTIKNLGLRSMNELPIMLPPEKEQRRIVAKVDELMALCDSLKNHINTVEKTQLQLADSIANRTLVEYI
jgi:type I restriction enzyme S subunit